MEGSNFFSGSMDSQKGENRQKMKNVEKNLSLQELMKTFKRWQNSCAFRLSVDSKNDWGGIKFDSNNCSSDFNQQIGDVKNLCQNGSKILLAETKERQEENMPWLFATDWKWSLVFRTCCYWWRVLDLWV